MPSPINIASTANFSASDINQGSSDFSAQADDFSATAILDTCTSGSATISQSTLSSGLTYGSCGTEPDSGVISFSSNNDSSGTIIFGPDCTVSGTWNNGSTSGGF